MKKLIIKLIIISFTFNSYIYSQCFDKVSCGFEHSLLIKTDGTLWAWGGNLHGEIGNFTDSYCCNTYLVNLDTNWENVRAGYYFSLAKKTDGTLWGWGDNQYHQLSSTNTSTYIYAPTQIGFDSDWLIFSSGQKHVTTIKTDGSLWSWGDNTYGQLGNGTNIAESNPIRVGLDNDWSTVSLGTFYNLALKSNGTLWAWGKNVDYGQLGDGTNVNKNTPTQIGTDNNWTIISAGNEFAVALKSNGTLWSWGRNGTGQLGDGTYINKNVPTQVGIENNWVSISAGAGHVLALKNDGSLWAWGSNNGFKLGDGTNINRLIPTHIGTLTSWQTVSAGAGHSMGILNNYSLLECGDNGFCQMGTGNNVGVIQTPTPLGACNLATSQFGNTTVTIFPNPTKTTLNITTKATLQKTVIYNLLGAKVYEQPYSDIIDLSSLANGMYIVKFYSNDNAVFVDKFVKE
jgi:alpha-tubulin suppressor-like RCC1 family protein